MSVARATFNTRPRPTGTAMISSSPSDAMTECTKNSGPTRTAELHGCPTRTRGSRRTSDIATPASSAYTSTAGRPSISEIRSSLDRPR
jgi:hypothetical protein